MAAFFFIALFHSVALACQPPQSCGQGNGNGNGNGNGINQGQGNRPPAAMQGNAGPPPHANVPPQSANVQNANGQLNQGGPVVVPNQNAAITNRGGTTPQQQMPLVTNNVPPPPGGQTGGRSMSNPDGQGVDKPYPAAGQAAGTQGPMYFDGNNGCGQDRKRDVARDFQGGYDDNNGHCGGAHQNSQAAVAPAQQGAVAPAQQAAVAPAQQVVQTADAAPLAGPATVTQQTPAVATQAATAPVVLDAPPVVSSPVVQASEVLTPGLVADAFLPGSPRTVVVTEATPQDDLLFYQQLDLGTAPLIAQVESFDIQTPQVTPEMVDVSLVRTSDLPVVLTQGGVDTPAQAPSPSPSPSIMPALLGDGGLLGLDQPVNDLATVIFLAGLAGITWLFLRGRRLTT